MFGKLFQRSGQKENFRSRPDPKTEILLSEDFTQRKLINNFSRNNSKNVSRNVNKGEPLEMINKINQKSKFYSPEKQFQRESRVIRSRNFRKFKSKIY